MVNLEKIYKKLEEIENILKKDARIKPVTRSVRKKTMKCAILDILSSHSGSMSVKEIAKILESQDFIVCGTTSLAKMVGVYLCWLANGRLITRTSYGMYCAIQTKNKK